MREFATITVRGNSSKRTFTIRRQITKGSKTKTICKYRTNKLPRKEYEDMEYWCQTDWSSFLNRTCDYYIV